MEVEYCLPDKDEKNEKEIDITPDDLYGLLCPSPGHPPFFGREGRYTQVDNSTEDRWHLGQSHLG